MKCSQCNFEETENIKMIGIFPFGTSFSGTNGKLIGLYGCPICKTITWTDDIDYINKRKKEYKKWRKNT